MIHHHKLPLLIFYHGGAFIMESNDSSKSHNFLNLVVSESNVVAISVNYRLAPEFPLPAAYKDSWEAIKWVGCSAGANMAIQAGSDIPAGLQFEGAILLHPYFWGKERIGKESDDIERRFIVLFDDLWAVANPGSSGPDDPLINPGMDPRITGMGCSKMLVFVGGNDLVKERGWYYKEVIEKSGWKGDFEMEEDQGEGHVYFLFEHFLCKCL